MRIVNRIINGFLLLIILLLIGSRWITFTVPIQMFHVLTGSMTPTIDRGSLIITTAKPTSDRLGIGDIITFEMQSELVTHQIVGLEERQDELFYTTKGDANDKNDFSPIKLEQIKGKVLFALPKLGKFANIIQSRSGKIALLLTVLQIWLLLDCLLLIKEIATENKMTMET